MSDTRIPRRRIAIIADDEDLGRVLLAEAVAAVGLEALTFANGMDALRRRARATT